MTQDHERNAISEEQYQKSRHELTDEYTAYATEGEGNE